MMMMMMLLLMMMIVTMNQPYPSRCPPPPSLPRQDRRGGLGIGLRPERGLRRRLVRKLQQHRHLRVNLKDHHVYMMIALEKEYHHHHRRHHHHHHHPHPPYPPPRARYSIPRGRWAHLPLPTPQPEYAHFSASVSTFGILDHPKTRNPAVFPTRSKEVCGLRSAMGFSPPEVLFECFERAQDWSAACDCMFTQVIWYMASSSSS
jgi:hypothetical protein